MNWTIDKFTKLLDQWRDNDATISDSARDRIAAIRAACTEASAQGFGEYLWDFGIANPAYHRDGPISVAWAVPPGTTKVIFTVTCLPLQP